MQNKVLLSLGLLFFSSACFAQSFAQRLHELAETFKARSDKPIEDQDVEKMINSIDPANPEKGWNAALEYLDLGRKLPVAKADALVFIPYDPQRSAELHPMAERRLLECIRLFKKGVAPKILITGNAPNPHQIYKKTAQFLVDHGIPEGAIEFEDLKGRKTLSGNTYQNIELGLKALQTLGAKSAVFVTSTYQMERVLRYYSKATAAGSHQLEEGVYWSSYINELDNDMPKEKRKYVLHEILAVIRDYHQFQNELTSPQMADKIAGRRDFTPITRCGELLNAM